MTRFLLDTYVIQLLKEMFMARWFVIKLFTKMQKIEAIRETQWRQVYCLLTDALPQTSY